MPTKMRADMESANRPLAFVAMKFNADHWRDKRYLVIREELEQAGFSSLRADEISTSGLVVDEVCRLLKEAALVVIDSSGDSQSVSYEVGYCHGVGRPPDTTLLLRSDSNIPYNYRHYRNRVYRDTRHLRRLIRDYLNMYEPITDDMYGYAFTFDYSEEAHFGYIYEGAACVFEALREVGFTGRAECYSMEHFVGERLFSVGLVVRRPGRKTTPDYQEWMKLRKLVSENAAKSAGRIALDNALSELASKRALKASYLSTGVAEFADGSIVRQIGFNDEDASSFFAKWVQPQS